MSEYIDGFVFPIPREHLDEYARMSKAVATIWKEHGALDYREYVVDDPHLEGTRSFSDGVNAAPGEAVVFGWVAFESREARDRANRLVANDARVLDLMAASDSGFDAQRMLYGGFRSMDE